MSEELLTRKELASKLKVSKPTIVKWEELGLPVIRVTGDPRYDYEKVIDWMEKSSQVLIKIKENK